MKKINICSTCNKKISQGHICNIKGLTVSDGRIAIPREARKNVFEREKIDQTYIYLPTGAQPTGKVITDEIYVQNIDNTIKALKDKKKKFVAGTEFSDR